MGDPIAKDTKPAYWLAYRNFKRETKNISDKTLNNHLVYLNLFLITCTKSKKIKYSNPLTKVDQIKIDEVELSWLTKEQKFHLLGIIDDFTQNSHVLLITKICLSTGARWGEAEGLKPKNVRNGAVTFNYTKGGKSRSIPLEEGLYKQVE